MWENESDAGLITRDRPKVKKPRMYRVIMHNDDFTTMEFVVLVLREIYALSQDRATAVMLDIHRKGKGEAGVYAREIAETKIVQTHERAKQAGYPLRCSMEPVEDEND